MTVKLLVFNLQLESSCGTVSAISAVASSTMRSQACVTQPSVVMASRYVSHPASVSMTRRPVTVAARRDLQAQTAKHVNNLYIRATDTLIVSYTYTL